MSSQSVGWLKETNSFLSSCPLDNQEFLPLTDFLLDDFIHLECIGDSENTKLAGECAVGEDEFCIDLMDSTYAQHQKDMGPEMTDFVNKYEKQKYDDECFPTINCLSKNSCFEDQLHNTSNCNDDDLPCSSENAMPLSSISQVLTSKIMDSLKNETYSDIGTFLEKEHDSYPSIDMITSKEDSILSDNDTSISKSPSASVVCLDDTHSCEQSEPTSHNFKDSDSSLDSDNTDSDKNWEPKKKVRRLNSTCKVKHKDTKYAEMRRKNNYASRRSRQTKKHMEKEMEEKAAALEKENEVLRIKEKKLEELVDKLKQMLFSSVKKK